MPANKPIMDDYISRFVNWVNSWRMTKAEIAVEEKTFQLPQEHRIHLMGSDQHASVMGLSAAEANFLAMLTRLLDSTPHKMKALDIGTFTGRSALAIAQAMPDGGEVIACEMNPAFEEVAKECWNKAGKKISDRITLKHGKAEDTLNELLPKSKGTFDLVFIDADKQNYPLYYEKALELLRPGGLVVLDNMLWSGRVAQEKFYERSSPDHDESASILRDLNLRIAKDKTVDATLLSFEDGVMVVQKRDRGQATIISRDEHEAADKRHEKILQHLRETTSGMSR